MTLGIRVTVPYLWGIFALASVLLPNPGLEHVPPESVRREMGQELSASSKQSEGAQPKGAQPKNAQPKGAATFGDSVEVVLVELDVVVRDKEGSPVRGLMADDFLVFEEGHERPIGGFSERDLPMVFARQKADATPLLEDESSAAPEGGVEPNTIVVFLDDVVLGPSRRARVVSRLARFFRSEGAPLLTGNARLALVVNERPLEIEIPPSGDLSAFLHALEALPPPPARSVRASIDRSRAVEDIGGNLRVGNGGVDECENDRGHKEIKIRNALTEYVASVVRRNDRTLGALEGLVSVVGGMEGRKVVLYVGEGVEVEPGVEMIQRANNACPGKHFGSYRQTPMAKDLMRIASYANSQRVTFYTFDSEGSRVGSIESRALSPEMRLLRTSNVHQSLTLLSRETGGRAFLNTGDPAWGFERITDDLRHVYQLAYIPRDGLSSEPRKVKVKLLGSGSGYKLFYRRAIVAISREERLVSKLLSALWLHEETNVLGVTADAQAPEGKTTGLEMHIKVPFASLLLGDLPAEEETSSIRLFLMARDPASGARTAPRHETRTLTREDLLLAKANQEVVFVVAMELPRGTYDVAVGVRDERTSRTSVVLVSDAVAQK